MTKLGAQDHIAKGKSPEAIAALLALLNDYLSKHTDDTFTLDLRNALISNSGKLAELSQNKIKGIVHREDESLTFSRVNAAVLEIIEQVPVSVWAGSTASKTITEQLKASKLLQDFIQKYGEDHPTNAFVELHETVVQTFGAYDDWSLLRVLEEMVEENKVRQEAISVHIPKAAKVFVAKNLGVLKTAQWIDFKDEVLEKYGEVMTMKELATLLEESRKRYQLSVQEMLKDFVHINDGEFTMGAPVDDPDAHVWEKPQHLVRLSDYYLSKYTITLGQFAEFIEETGYQIDADKDKDGGSNLWNGSNWEKKTGVSWYCDVKDLPQIDPMHPVIHVSWNDAVAFCNYWNAKYGFSPTYDSNGKLLDPHGKITSFLTQVQGFRLPSEAEWEYACRAGTTTSFYTGDTITIEQANFNNQLGRTQPVGSYAPNPWGLYDMHGNIWEWCQDNFDEKFYEKLNNQKVVKNPLNLHQGSHRVLRGGGWYGDPLYCRSSYRRHNFPAFRGSIIGFRVVLFSPPDSWPVPSN